MCTKQVHWNVVMGSCMSVPPPPRRTIRPEPEPMPVAPNAHIPHPTPELYTLSVPQTSFTFVLPTRREPLFYENDDTDTYEGFRKYDELEAARQRQLKIDRRLMKMAVISPVIRPAMICRESAPIVDEDLYYSPPVHCRVPDPEPEPPTYHHETPACDYDYGYSSPGGCDE